MEKVSDMILSTLEKSITDFLDCFGKESLTGKSFCDIIGLGDGEAKYSRLLKAAGYEDQSEGFVSWLVRALEKADSSAAEPIAINGLALPHLLLVSVLEKIIPGDRLFSVREVSQLERLTNITVPEKDRAGIQKVIETFPVRLSAHVIRQMRVSKAVAHQYLPSAEESDPAGLTDTWIGQFRQGILEQMYPNRVILLLNMTCPVYCRFCFRKHRESRNQPEPGVTEIKKAIEYIKETPNIKEVLLTGGDPFLNRENLIYAINELAKIPHVRTLRIGTRSVAYYPSLFYAARFPWLAYLKDKNAELLQKGKRIEIAVHFVHPDEISPESLRIISELTKNGVTVYVQTPFLKNCNDKNADLKRLFSLLRGAGAEIHYLFMPCEPVRGSSEYWTSVSKGLDAAGWLRAHLSDRAFPKVSASTPIGKIDWHTSGWAVEKDKENDAFIWIRTPYTPSDFKDFAPDTYKREDVRVNAEGTAEVRFMAEIGDEEVFSGLCSDSSLRLCPDLRSGSGLRLRAQSAALEDQREQQTIVETGSSTLFRIHKTRVETDARAGERDVEYIRNHKEVTDVIISSRGDTIEHLCNIGKIIRKLGDIPHVNAVRLRSLKFNYAPETYTRTVTETLGNLNRLSIANPLRLEIETRFLHSDEFGPLHGDLANALRNKGITVYNNTPLLCGINNTPDEILRIAYECRAAGIEFHHLYVAGLPFQKLWNKGYPTDIYHVIEIASRLRRHGSGREIPRYIIRTDMGEVDFGLTSEFSEMEGELRLRLLPYDLSYYRNMDPDFAWPDDVKTDAAGKPMISFGKLSVS